MISMSQVNLIEYIIEQVRQGRTGDTEYYKSLRYAFQLVTQLGHGSTGTTGRAFFPLPINPQVFEYDMPFAGESYPLQESGVLSEEGGICIGHIRLEATTGQQLRRNKDTSMPALGPFTGSLSGMTMPGELLSGQMALWRLLGRCFDTYSELKKDPTVAAVTWLEFHNIKDRVHLQVVPRLIRVPRNVSDARVIYRYHIELDVVGEAPVPSATDLALLSDEQSILGTINDAIQTMRGAWGQLKAVVDDVVAAADAMARTITNLAGIVDDLLAVTTAVEDLVTGKYSFINCPEALMIDLLADLEAAETIANQQDAWPPKAKRIWATATDQVESVIVAARGLAREPWDARAERHIQRIQKHANLTDTEKTSIATMSAKATTSGGRMTTQQTFGGPWTPGDAMRSEGADPSPSLTPGRYTGYQEARISGADTLESLATRYLKDPARWRDIAVINDLRPPYVAYGARLPHTVIVGDTVLIPIAKPTQPGAILSRGNTAGGSSQIEAAMGRDVRLVDLGHHRYGWVIDEAHGSVDLQYVEGIPNLVQGLGTRLRTERGTNANFPTLGVPRLEGKKAFAQLWMEARYAVHQTILEDPRIATIRGIQIEIQNQVVVLNIDAQPVGFDTSRPIPVILK